MKRGRKPDRAPVPAEAFHNPFGALEARRGQLTDRPAPEPSQNQAANSKAVAAPRRAVIRIERSGRAGKEVTLVEQLELSPASLMTWLVELKRSLGCGGTVENRALLFQGDQRQRLETALRARGVKTIVVSPGRR